MIVLASLGLLLGALVAEVLLRRRRRFAQGLDGVLTGLRRFHAASDDDERQARLIEAGLGTLRFSAASALFLAVLLAVVAAPALLLAASARETLVYALAASASAVAWWFIARGRHASRGTGSR